MINIRTDRALPFYANTRTHENGIVPPYTHCANEHPFPMPAGTEGVALIENPPGRFLVRAAGNVFRIMGRDEFTEIKS